MLRPIQEIATRTPLFTRLVAVATHLPEAIVGFVCGSLSSVLATR
jgi:hypothetical protein